MNADAPDTVAEFFFSAGVACLPRRRHHADAFRLLDGYLFI